MSKIIIEKQSLKITIPHKITVTKYKELQNTRIIQKNLIHVIGISLKLCDKEVSNKIKI